MALDPATRRELHWSQGEKKTARAAFDKALARETAAIRKEVESMLQRSNEANAVWDVHEFLSKKLRELELKYDYRYSVLVSVFGRLRAMSTSRVSMRKSSSLSGGSRGSRKNSMPNPAIDGDAKLPPI